MDRVYMVLFLCISVIFASAQVFIPNDTATTGFSNAEMTFYNTATGTKTTVRNDDWHVALSVRNSQFPTNTLQGTTIRINGGMGVRVFQVPNFTADSFYVAVDTTGYLAWPQLVDAETVLDEGALNTGKNIAVFNYGWGVYGGSPNHDVIGIKVYLFELPGGVFKKFWVEELDRDTAWVLKVANPNNSNLQTIRISKSDYAGKNLVYLNLQNNTVHDKEPLSANWDLLFLKYAATNFVLGIPSPVVGVLANKGVKVAQRTGSPTNSNDYTGLNFLSDMNAIGWDWKYYVNNRETFSGKDIEQSIAYYKIRDSLSFFIQNRQGVVSKIVFTSYSGVQKGLIGFYKETLNVSNISEPEEVLSLRIFPNPCNTFLNVNATDLTGTPLQIYDINGRAVAEVIIRDEITQLNTSDFFPGVYLLTLNTSKGRVVKKFIVTH